MCKKMSILILATIWASFSGLTNTAYADDVKYIQTSHVDLSNHYAVEGLYMEIVSAAIEVCSSKVAKVSGTVRASSKYAINKCVRSSVSNAVRRANMPALISVYKSHPRRTRFSYRALQALQVASAQ